MVGGKCAMSLTLIKPSEEYIEEIRAFRQEFVDNNVELNGASGLQKYEDLSAWIAHCRNMENRAYAEPLGFVEGEQFMLVSEGEARIFGMIAFRHYLNKSLEKAGGHIGYSIRPSAWRKGYGKAMLSLCLEKCYAFGLDNVLITCNTNNEASRKTILANGGAFDRLTKDGDEILERYRVPCGEVHIRKAEIEDAATVATVLCESWKLAYKDIITPEEMARNTDVDNRTKRFHSIIESGGMGPIFIASYRGRPCGIVSFGKSRDADLPNAAEVISIYTLDTVWSKGVGHAMMEFTLAELRRQGYHEVLLWVFEANDRARKFYERHGFSADGAVKDSGFGNAQEVRYRRAL
jgi:predicted acetyltransferase